ATVLMAPILICRFSYLGWALLYLKGQWRMSSGTCSRILAGRLVGIIRPLEFMIFAIPLQCDGFNAGKSMVSQSITRCSGFAPILATPRFPTRTGTLPAYQN